ncbi:MAG: hypothetical protein AAF543_14855 [Pseudomonadota bacterium]
MAKDIRLTRRRIAETDRKLTSTCSRDKIFGPAIAGNNQRYVVQEHVATWVTQRLIDQVQTLQSADDNGKRCTSTAMIDDRVVDVMMKEAVVVELGLRIQNGCTGAIDHRSSKLAAESTLPHEGLQPKARDRWKIFLYESWFMINPFQFSNSARWLERNRSLFPHGHCNDTSPFDPTPSYYQSQDGLGPSQSMTFVR